MLIIIVNNIAVTKKKNDENVPHSKITEVVLLLYLFLNEAHFSHFHF